MQLYSKYLLTLLLSLPTFTSLNAQGKDPVSMGYLAEFSADIDSGGEMSTDRWDISGGLPVVNNDTHFAAVTLSYAYNDYQFSDTTKLWDDITQISLGVPWSWKFNDKWKWSSVVRIGSTRESGGDIDQSYNAGVVTSLNYKFNETLTLGPGFSCFSELEDSVSVIPILSIDWKFANDWRLSTGPSAGANSGANVYLNYVLNEKWNFSAGVYFQNQRFRLSSDSIVAADGVGEESYIAAYAVAQYAPTDHLALSLIGGWGFARELTVYDDTGSELLEEDLGNSPFAGMRISYKF